MTFVQYIKEIEEQDDIEVKIMSLENQIIMCKDDNKKFELQKELDKLLIVNNQEYKY